MTDPYQVLSVAKGVSLEELKDAFRRLSRQHHPDFPGGSQEAMPKCWSHTDRPSKN
jgi:DnaJ-class molecular chaperone